MSMQVDAVTAGGDHSDTYHAAQRKLTEAKDANAKAGIDVLGKSLARALAPTVRVLTVSPGVVESSFVPGRGADFNAKAAASTPLKRVGQPDDVARVIAYLISPFVEPGHRRGVGRRRWGTAPDLRSDRATCKRRWIRQR